ncbi:phage virion morphogenesis protein [Providencia rettgeri]
MASLVLHVDAHRTLKALQGMLDATANLTPMLQDIGEALLILHQARFRAEQSPDGMPWTALRPWYRDSKTRNADKVLTLTGQLADTLRYQIQGQTLFFGTDRPYGAIHHFGGTISPKTAGALNVGGRPVKKVVIPPRPWLGTSAEDGRTLLDIARQHLMSLSAS